MDVDAALFCEGFGIEMSFLGALPVDEIELLEL
jgi:hypothetical protein